MVQLLLVKGETYLNSAKEKSSKILNSVKYIVTAGVEGPVLNNRHSN
jgi:hypothetical protein